MYCNDQQIHLIRFFSLFNAKTGYGRLDTARSLDNSLWSLSRSWSPKLWNVSEQSTFSRSRSGVGVKNSRLRTPLQRRWADCEIFQSESSHDPIKLNPIQSWSANVKSFSFLLRH